MDLQIKIIENRPITSNCYVVSAVDRDACIIVDPGSRDGNGLFAYLEQESLSPQYIILTHEHFDHIGGVDLLRQKYECRLVTSSTCTEAIVSEKKNLSLFYDGEGFCVDEADLIVEDINYKLFWEDMEICFLETKGHSRGSICFVLDNYLFTGDTLIYKEKTVTKLPGGEHRELIQTLEKLTKYKGLGYQVLPGHGNSFALDDYDFGEALG